MTTQKANLEVAIEKTGASTIWLRKSVELSFLPAEDIEFVLATDEEGDDMTANPLCIVYSLLIGEWKVTFLYSEEGEDPRKLAQNLMRHGWKARTEREHAEVMTYA